MDLARKIGIAIVFIIPSFVFSGLFYDGFDSVSKTAAWTAVVVVLVILAAVYTLLVRGCFSGERR
ncbi:MAG: hypothetical protein DRH56_09640 [Deltaproteobacteria bacterium]|nr:MAG: hypothetical protein DRH56_09640 [Deltaproteobacteria bacterium]